MFYILVGAHLKIQFQSSFKLFSFSLRTIRFIFKLIMNENEYKCLAYIVCFCVISGNRRSFTRRGWRVLYFCHQITELLSNPRVDEAGNNYRGDNAARAL